MRVIARVALVVGALLCLVSHALGIEAGHDAHQYIFVAIGHLQMTYHHWLEGQA